MLGQSNSAVRFFPSRSGGAIELSSICSFVGRWFICSWSRKFGPRGVTAPPSSHDSTTLNFQHHSQRNEGVRSRQREEPPDGPLQLSPLAKRPASGEQTSWKRGRQLGTASGSRGLKARTTSSCASRECHSSRLRSGVSRTELVPPVFPPSLSHSTRHIQGRASFTMVLSEVGVEL